MGNSRLVSDGVQKKLDGDMFKKIRAITINLIAAANIVTAIIMLMIGYSGRVCLADYPLLANIGLVFPLFVILNLLFLVFWLIFYKRCALIPFVAFVLCYYPVRDYAPLNMSQDTPEGALKILSYNVCMFGAETLPDMRNNPIINYIRECNADIVCLQEARIDAQLISETKDIYNYRDSAVKYPSGTALVVLSKYPVVGKEHINYASRGNISTAFYIKIDNDTVVVVNNHLETSGLSLSDRAALNDIMKGKSKERINKRKSIKFIDKLAESARIRAPQADSVAAFIDRHQGKSIIVCGDFNENPISYAHHRISEKLTDCFVESGNGLGISYNRNSFYVRIDHIMCSNDWKPYNFKVDNEIKVSDHYPMYGWLEKVPK